MEPLCLSPRSRRTLTGANETRSSVGRLTNSECMAFASFAIIPFRFNEIKRFHCWMQFVCFIDDAVVECLRKKNRSRGGGRRTHLVMIVSMKCERNAPGKKSSKEIARMQSFWIPQLISQSRRCDAMKSAVLLLYDFSGCGRIPLLFRVWRLFQFRRNLIHLKCFCFRNFSRFFVVYCSTHCYAHRSLFIFLSLALSHCRPHSLGIGFQRLQLLRGS